MNKFEGLAVEINDTFSCIPSMQKRTAEAFDKILFLMNEMQQEIDELKDRIEFQKDTTID